MFPTPISVSSASFSDEASVASSCPRRSLLHDFCGFHDVIGAEEVRMLPAISNPQPHPQLKKIRKKRSLPGNPDPDAEVIALSPRTLMTTNRFVCEVCNKGFQRDQNLQLHRRGHNLPWKLKQRNRNADGDGLVSIRKRAYVCPEPTCVHHHPSRALGDLTGIKKHYCRKHGEKKWKCEKCGKVYAVQSDWRAHAKTCGTREYRCDCGTIFSRKDSYVTHRAFCDALAEETTRLSASQFATPPLPLTLPPPPPLPIQQTPPATSWDQLPHPQLVKPGTTPTFGNFPASPLPPLPFHSAGHLSATALLQKATAIGAAASEMTSQQLAMGSISNIGFWNNKGAPDSMTRDFLGLTWNKNLNIAENNNNAADHRNNVVRFASKVSMDIHQGYIYGSGEQQPSIAECDAFGYSAGTWTC
ncbi:hypothetical protein MLD38_031829 [Melastoma candidum]|uniref:Uncharacterized protein n=1 Tax=Melastoma candidum TaxID=119954 RepID=A0ACB9MS11_9MYRT|nr:hypothetical protein MLD38_031829 [Melastoma candidum]